MQEAGNLAGVADEGGWWPAFATNEQALDTLVRAIERAGFRPGEQVGIALDIAASEFGAQRPLHAWRWSDRELYTDGDDRAADRLGRRATRSCRSRTRWRRTTRTGSPRSPAPLGGTRADRRRRFPRHRRRSAEGRGGAGGGEHGAAEAEPARHPDRDARCAAGGAECGYATIVSARSGETEDVTIAHLAVGWGAGQLKVGSFARGERMAKWNEMLRIEEALGGKARFAGGAVLGRSPA